MKYGLKAGSTEVAKMAERRLEEISLAIWLEPTANPGPLQVGLRSGFCVFVHRGTIMQE